MNELEQQSKYVGIDIGAESLSVSIYSAQQGASRSVEFANNAEGLEQLLEWLAKQDAPAQKALVCLEATGVYGEAVCYFLHAKGYRLVVEAPHKAKRAFHSEHKNDDVDARQLGEYAYRYGDQLTLWHPKTELVEQVGVLLNLREQLSKQMTANRNLLKALQRKVTPTPLAARILQETITQLQQQMQTIETEIKRLLHHDPPSQQKMTHLLSIPGVGLLLAANLFVLTEGFEKSPTAQQLAAHLGLSPLEHRSGTSVYRKPTSRGQGHERIRKLLYLASMTLAQHQTKFQHYFLRKVAEGKDKRLVLNNIANKLLRIIAAILKNDVQFIKGYQSINPAFLNNK